MKLHTYMPRHHTISWSSPRTILVVLAVFIISLLVLYSQHLPSRLHSRVLGDTTQSFTLSSLDAAINLARTSNQIKPVQPNTILNQVAAAKAKDIITKAYWAHSSSPTVSPWSFLDASGYKYLYAGENLARNFHDSESVVNAWLKSPGHRANLLNPNYSQVGVAVVDNTKDPAHSPIIVAVFAKPLPPELASLENQPSHYTTTQLIADSLPIVDLLLLSILIPILIFLGIRIIIILKRLHHHHFVPSPKLWHK